MNTFETVYGPNCSSAVSEVYAHSLSSEEKNSGSKYLSFVRSKFNSVHAESALKIGDIVIYYTWSNRSRIFVPNHTAVYLGKNLLYSKYNNMPTGPYMFQDKRNYEDVSFNKRTFVMKVYRKRKNGIKENSVGEEYIEFGNIEAQSRYLFDFFVQDGIEKNTKRILKALKRYASLSEQRAFDYMKCFAWIYYNWPREYGFHLRKYEDVFEKIGFQLQSVFDASRGC